MTDSAGFEDSPGIENSEPRRRVAVVVLGMHRSGTSALTRVISLLGAKLPNDLLGANPTNPAGHWEPQRLVSLHDAMLAEAGSRWDDWRAFDLSLLGSERARHYVAEMRRILTDDFSGADLIVLKEPRISRFAPIYDGILSDLGYDVRYVLTLRNPLAVMTSLGKRDGFLESYTGLVWLRHELDAESATRGKRRVMISYEGLLDDWRSGIETIRSGLDLTWPVPEEEAEEDISANLSRDLQHSAPTEAELIGDPQVQDWVKAAYLALVQLHADAGDTSAMGTLDAIKAEFDRASAAFGAAFYPELRRRETKAEIDVSNLQRAWEQSTAGYASLQAQAAQREAHLTTLSHTVAAVNQVAVDNSAAVARLVQEIADKDKLIQSAQAEAGALRTRLQEMEQAQAQVRETLAARDAQVSGLQELLTAKDAQIESQQGTLESRGAMVASLQAALAARDVQIGTLEGELQTRRAAVHQAQELVEQTQASLTGVMGERDAQQRTVAALQALLSDQMNRLSKLSESLEAGPAALASMREQAKSHLAELANFPADDEASANPADLHDTALDVQFLSLQGVLIDRIAAAYSKAAEGERVAEDLRRSLLDCDKRIAELHASTSWRVTSGLRMLKRLSGGSDASRPSTR